MPAPSRRKPGGRIRPRSWPRPAIRSSTRSRGHALDVQIDPDVPVRLDPRLTATALAHLLENAAQYAPAGSTITLSVARAGDEVLIRVRDRGPGIAPGDLPRLFERFYRGMAAASRASGTGMGLWIARGLLAAEHGRIWAENAPGRRRGVHDRGARDGA